MNSLLLIWFTIYLIDCKQIQLTRRTVKDNLFETEEEIYFPLLFKMKIGTPPEEFDFALDTASYPLWLPNQEIKDFFKKVFNQTDSKTFNFIQPNIPMHIESYDGIITGNEVTDKLSNPFNEYKEENTDEIFESHFNWMLANIVFFEYFSADGSVGFARNYPNTKFPLDKSDNGQRYSFIDYLLKEKVITEKVFSITRSSQTNGVLTIGEYDNKLFQSKTKGKCYSAKEYDSFYFANIANYWNCKVIKISLGNKVLPNSSFSDNNAMIFATNTEFIFSPLEIGLRIFDNVIKIIGKEANCTVQGFKNSKTIMCNKFDYLKQGEKLNLTMKLEGGYELSAYTKDLWKKFNETHLQFNVVAMTQNIYWKIGEPMLKYENMLFQYSDNSITMVKYSEINLLLYLIIGGSVLVITVIVIGIMLYFKYRKVSSSKQKKEKEKEEIKGIVNEVDKEALISPEN